MKKVLISVVGPTAIGKTKLAIALANHFNTVILSADSRQFYKEMRIGTAVPAPTELAAATHYFIQHKSIKDSYSVGDFEKEAILLLHQLFAKTNVIIMVGGSGLYVNAVTQGLDIFPKVDTNIRKSLNILLKEEGIAVLQKKLKSLDKRYYEQVALENPHRLIRALEICIGTGKPFSSFLNQKKNARTFKTLTVGLTADRQVIYDNINKRVDIMIKEGLIEEASSLLPHRSLNALQTVGYKELFQYFDKIWSLDFAISEIKKNTRRFAKRQLTWFKKNEDTVWFPHDMPTKEILEKIGDLYKSI